MTLTHDTRTNTAFPVIIRLGHIAQAFFFTMPNKEKKISAETRSAVISGELRMSFWLAQATPLLHTATVFHDNDYMVPGKKFEILFQSCTPVATKKYQSSCNPC